MQDVLGLPGDHGSRIELVDGGRFVSPAVLCERAEGEYRESARDEGGEVTFDRPFAATLGRTR
ncbi:hypothetical protein [Amycolatopsis granulosa]|uniref:hypothetical protein n=1 Tax=Amycolatopsis granulosa TaxID=185684 RepID=UPI001FB92F20|nr:hypothetical protein [Amycolatopsis granulosa]NIH87917.1 hypothetical protein [Amycolatopsis granulosa]